MTRVLIGEALVNEDERLQARINQLTDKLEAALRQSLRIAQAANGWHGDAQADAAVLIAYVARPLAALRQERLQAHAAGRLGAAAQVPVPVTRPAGTEPRSRARLRPRWRASSTRRSCSSSSA